MTLLRRFLALVVALALAALAVLVAVEAVGIRTGEHPVVLPLDDWERSVVEGDWSTWSADAWTLTSGVVLAVGLVLVVLQLIPHRMQALDRRPTDDVVDGVRFGRRGLEDRLHDVAVDQDEVIGASIKVRKRRIRAVGRVPQGTDRAAAESTVHAALTGELDRLDLDRRPRLRVDIERASDRVA